MIRKTALSTLIATVDVAPYKWCQVNGIIVADIFIKCFSAVAISWAAQVGNSMRTRTIGFTAALLIGSCGNLAAESVMEDVLVTGTFSPRPVLTSSVSVLDTEQIQAPQQNLSGRSA